MKMSKEKRILIFPFSFSIFLLSYVVLPIPPKIVSRKVVCSTLLMTSSMDRSFTSVLSPMSSHKIFSSFISYLPELYFINMRIDILIVYDRLSVFLFNFFLTLIFLFSLIFYSFLFVFVSFAFSSPLYFSSRSNFETHK
jgi:hypothetical protein